MNETMHDKFNNMISLNQLANMGFAQAHPNNSRMHNKLFFICQTFI